MIDSPEAKFAVAAVREAAQLVRRVQAEMVTDALEKGDKSPVTVGDFTAQAVIARRLQDNFPGVKLVGEESAADLREEAGTETLEQVTHFVRMVLPHATAEEVCDWIDFGTADAEGEYWTLDPIDGTKGFLRGDQYAVAFALIKDGQVQVAALGCPELADATSPAKGGDGSVLLAAKGQGARCQSMADPSAEWKPLSTSDLSDPAGARVLRSVEKGHTNMGQIDYFAEALGITADPVGMDSQAKYAVLAAGGGEMLLRLMSPKMPDYQERIWDQAAGSLVITEAGGRVTDLDGRPLDFSHGRTLAQNRGVLATNGPLHDAALEALKSVGA
ncbi:Histidinol-phosphatase [Posidoniimonas polymericola]|uniref:3'(2'),5'-bisphosphate nucleotidase n=1 Tax=Posidoniimonas polymericola TaxID=2528002 RepID=A0A5C5YUU1_9BACT|nr:3'(2'),5'-bisphosphate nucleotidase [Posidoniimonas polymericola]TWT78581.1 Histidinol-phosphatase [Posidoniimonas polymericola]